MTYFKKAFGQNLKLLRKAKNLTQEQLAELVNLNQRQLTRIENGISFVSSDVIERLIVALNIDVKTLFDFQLEKEILCQTGTDNTPYYRVIDNNKVVVIEEYQSKIDKNKLEEKVIKEAPDKYLLDVSQKLGKPIFVQYFKDNKLTETYTYNPNGNIDFISNEKEETKEKKIEKLLYKIKKIANNEKQLKYVDLAIESLFNSSARKELKTLIDGMDLLE